MLPSGLLSSAGSIMQPWFRAVYVTRADNEALGLYNVPFGWHICPCPSGRGGILYQKWVCTHGGGIHILHWLRTHWRKLSLAVLIYIDTFVARHHPPVLQNAFLPPLPRRRASERDRWVGWLVGASAAWKKPYVSDEESAGSA